MPVFADGNRVTVSTPIITDLYGNPITGSIQAGQHIQFQANFTNNQKIDQPFAYILQVKNGHRVTVELSWVSGVLSAGTSYVLAQGGTPIYSGKYTAQIFVWQKIDDPLPLYHSFTIPFQVKGGNPHHYTTVPVTLSGTVNPPLHGGNVVLLILNPSNNYIQIAHTSVAANGKFSTNIIAGGPLFTSTGTYHVLVEYDGVKQNSLSFSCSSVSPISCS